jgi:hypothetical protein
VKRVHSINGTGGFHGDMAGADRTPTFTPTKKWNGYTLSELRTLLPYDQGRWLTDETINTLARLLTEPRK